MHKTNISQTDYKIRLATLVDQPKILDLYKKVAKNAGGIARTAEEVTEEYIKNNLEKSDNSGICLVIEDPFVNRIIGEIHCYKLVPKIFRHILTELTVVVDNEYQNKGLGKLLFTSLFNIIETSRTDILRVELIARESNEKAIRFYEKLGFKIEGRFEKRVNGVEADIPMAWFNENYVSETSTKDI